MGKIDERREAERASIYSLELIVAHHRLAAADDRKVGDPALKTSFISVEKSAAAEIAGVA